MVDLTSIAIPYARAVYEHAKQYDTLQHWNEMLFVLSECIVNHKVKILLGHPVYSQQDIARVIRNAFSSTLDEYGINFLMIVTEYNRLAVIPRIYQLFLLLQAEDKKVKKAKITTAFEMSESLEKDFALKLAEKYKCEIKIEKSIDASLIGGAKIEIGDQVIDGSIKNKLHNLQSAIEA